MVDVVVEVGHHGHLDHIVVCLFGPFYMVHVSGFIVHLELIPLMTICEPYLEAEIWHVTKEFEMLGEKDGGIARTVAPGLAHGRIEGHPRQTHAVVEPDRKIVVDQEFLLFAKGGVDRQFREKPRGILGRQQRDEGESQQYGYQ